jgi:glycine/D-amino acid oxidase-like deaminating enzyme
LFLLFLLTFNCVFAEPDLHSDEQVMPTEGVSHWLKVPHPLLHNFQSTPQLPTEVDVLIIGSGLGGLGAAEQLSNFSRTLKIAVVDARGVAEGATSHNGGNFQPMPENFIDRYESLLEERYKRSKENFPTLSEPELRQMAKEQALTLLKFGSENGKLFKSIVANYNLNPDISDAGWMRLANSAQEEIDFQRDVEIARSVGISMEIWSAEKITRLTGIQTEFGGRFTPGYGNYHPYKFATQLFEQLLKKGILLYTQTRVTHIDWSTPTDRPVLVQTERGPILAKRVIVATDAYTAKMIPAMKDFVFPFQSQIVTYDNISAKEVPLLQTGWTLTERDGDLYGNIPKATKYIDADGVERAMYLVGGGPDRLVDDPDAPPLSREMYDVIVEQTGFRFPGLKNRLVSSTWTGVFGFTPHRLPYLSYVTHNNVYDPRVIMTVGSQGYGGGMSLFGGHLAGQLALLPAVEGEALLRKHDPRRFFELPPLEESSTSAPRSCRSLF